MAHTKESSNSKRGEARMLPVVAAVAIALAASPFQAAADQSSGRPVVDGWTSFFKYAGCAAGIAFATTTAQIWVAGISCAALLSEELGR